MGQHTVILVFSHVIKDMFGLVDFREDEKNIKKRENFLKGLWLEGREKKEMMRPKCFLPGSPKNFIPQMRRKLVCKNTIK